MAQTTDEWNTPKWLAELLGPFDLDPASNSTSHIMALRTATAETDGLSMDWSGQSVFCNGPYSNPLPWCVRLARHDAPWCALWKLDPTTRWWAELMRAAPTVAPFRKRLKFEGGPGAPAMTANFPSVLIWSAWQPPAALVDHLWMPGHARAA
jgi:hypothetical protein